MENMRVKASLIPGILVFIMMLIFPTQTYYATADASGAWYEQQSGTPMDLFGIAAADKNTAWAVGGAGSNHIILKTTDGGTSWTPQLSNSGNLFRGVASVDAETAWVVGLNIILKTTDAGATWTTQNSGPNVPCQGISAVDAQTAWVVGGSKILKTTDGGTTWNFQTSPTMEYFNAVSAVDSNTAWAVGGVTGYLDSAVVIKTTDGGTNWSVQYSTTGTLFNGVAAIDANNAWVVGRTGQILRTTDGGLTWNSQISGTPKYINGITAFDSNTAWVTGYEGYIASTDDGGNTWSAQNSGTSGMLYGICSLGSNPAWAVGAKGVILHSRAATGQFISYFAEGYTGPGFQEYLCLENPEAEKIHAVITFMFKGGGTSDYPIDIPSGSRSTVDVNGVLNDAKEVSAEITSDKYLVCERPMYFNYQGKWTGGHDSGGAASLSKQLYFAEGCTLNGFDEWICVLNPGDTQANLTFDFETQEKGEIVRNQGYAVAPHSRESFKANDVLGQGYQTSLKLESDQPIAAERPMYFNYSGTNNHNWTGGHCVSGVPEARDTFYFAEGTTRPGFEEWLTIQNPNTGPMNVRATYQLGMGQGDPITKEYNIAGGRRMTLYIPQEVGDGKDVSIYLTSASNYLAERPMYFHYSFMGADWTGGHCVVGANVLSKSLYFAEGYTGPHFQEWLCLQNPGDSDATCEIIFHTQEAGDLPIKTITVPLHSRVTLMVNQLAGPNYQLSTEVKVISGPGIVAERPMYFNYNGVWDGGHDVVGSTP